MSNKFIYRFSKYLNPQIVHISSAQIFKLEMFFFSKMEQPLVPCLNMKTANFKCHEFSKGLTSEFHLETLYFNSF